MSKKITTEDLDKANNHLIAFTDCCYGSSTPPCQGNLKCYLMHREHNEWYLDRSCSLHLSKFKETKWELTELTEKDLFYLRIKKEK